MVGLFSPFHARITSIQINFFLTLLDMSAKKGICGFIWGYTDDSFLFCCMYDDFFFLLGVEASSPYILFS